MAFDSEWRYVWGFLVTVLRCPILIYPFLLLSVPLYPSGIALRCAFATMEEMFASRVGNLVE